MENSYQLSTESKTEEEFVESERSLFLKGQHFLEIGDYKLAESIYDKIVSQYPTSPALGTAYYYLSDLYVTDKRYAKAISALEKIALGYPAFGMIEDARYKLARLYFDAGRFDEALPLLEGFLKRKKPSLDRLDIVSRLADIYSSNRYIDSNLDKAVAILLLKKTLLKDAGQRAVVAVVDDRIRGLVENCSNSQLNDLITVYPKRFPGDIALVRLIEINMDNHDYFNADRHVKQFLASFRRHPFRARAAGIIDKIEMELKGKKYLVGVGLHLSDSMSVFGNNILNGVKLAYDEGKANNDELGLLIKDFTKNNLFSPINEMTKKYRPVAIIGPMLSSEVVKVAGVVSRYGIPMVSPSASRDSAGRNNRYFFRVSMTDGEMIRQIVGFAHNDLGLKRFAMLRPLGRYYSNMSVLFKKELKAAGGQLVLEKTYSEKQYDYSTVIKELIRKDLAGGGKMVLERDLLENGSSDAKKKPETDKNKNNKRIYQPGFDAIFVPGDAESVGILIPQLAFFDIGSKNTQVLGDNAWSALGLLRQGNKFAVGAYYVDGFFRNSRDEHVSGFVTKYKKKYGTEPDIFAAQGYDAMKIIIAGIEDGIENGVKSGVEARKAIRDFLAGLTNYQGASGQFTIAENGWVEKDLFILNVKKRKIIEVERIETVSMDSSPDKSIQVVNQ